MKHPTSRLQQYVIAEIELGIAQAADPLNANLPDLALRTTTLSSPWFARSCRVCRDKFREGDQVRLCPRCNAPYHDDELYGLRCWQKQFSLGAICNAGEFDSFSESSRGIKRCEFSWSDLSYGVIEAPTLPAQEALAHASPTQLLVGQFVAGVETTWHTFGDQHRIRVPSRSPLLGRKCPWCRFRVRAGDWIVACPCQGNCGTFFHQDVFRHLTCWNEWNGVKGHNYCPTTGAPLHSNEEGH